MRPSIDISRDVEGETYDGLAIESTHLKFSSLSNDVLLKGGSQLASLRQIKNVILTLQNQFSSSEGPKLIFEHQRKDDFSKRLLLIQGQVEGLLRRRIEYSTGNAETGERVLDYSNLLNEKENEIVELQKKINNLEERLRRASLRESQLENRIVDLNRHTEIKQEIINAKNQVILAEVASTNLFKDSIERLRKNLQRNKSRIGELDRVILQGVILPENESFDIKPDFLIKDGAQSRTRSYQDAPEDRKIKTKVVQMFRQFERLFKNNNVVSQQQIDIIIQGFLTQFKGSRLYTDVQTSIKRLQCEQDLLRLRENFTAAASIYQQTIDELNLQHPQLRINIPRNLFEILQKQQITVYKTENQGVYIGDLSERTVEVPVQDARTKHLIHLFAKQLKRLHTKYPKLYEQIDVKVSQFFQQQIIDLIEVDELDRLVEIVKYEPQVVKVENVYAYNSEKTRKVQFHLRVLIKTLLEQLQKLKIKSGLVLELDEGVVGMIRQEIMGIVDVDDILKVFRVVPKIVEVEKIVEKIVQRIVEVPKVMTVDRMVQKIVEIEVIKQVDRQINVPLETPVIYDRVVQKIVPIENIIERVVEVPTIVERIVEITKQTPVIQQVVKVEQIIVEVDRVVEVERVVNHFETKYEQVTVIEQKAVPVQRIIQKIVQVEVIVEKIVEKIVEVPQIIEVEKRVEIVVPVIEYRNARQVQNHVEIQHQIVQRIVQKPVRIIQTVEKIVEVPRVVEKIVTLVNTQTKIVEVERIVEKIVVEERIKQVQKVITQIVENIKEVPKQVTIYVDRPLIHEKLVVVKQFIEKPIIQRVQNTVVKQVILREPLIIKEPKIVQVEKIVTHFVDVIKPFKYIEEKIFQVPKIIDRIKQVRVHVEKLVEKIVEVPKIVEVEKIVQKVVVVPRVVQKVVEIPQKVEVVVEKEVIKEIIRQVEVIVERPIIQERHIEVPIEKNIYIEVERIVDRIVDKLVEVPRLEQTFEIREIIHERIVEVIKQIPKIMEVQKVVTLYQDCIQVLQVEKPLIVPLEIAVPVDRIIQKIVVQENIIERAVVVPQIVQKIVTITKEEAIIHEIEKIVEKIVIDREIKEVERIVPYIQQVIKEVPTIVEKIIAVESKYQEIVTAQLIIEKVIQKTNTIPKIYNTEVLREVMVEVPKIIEVERIVPHLVNVNNYIQKIVQKIVEVPVIVEQLKQVQKQIEKVVQVENVTREIVEVQKVVEKLVMTEKMKEVVRNVNHIEKVLQIVDRLVELSPVQITAREEVLVEVPYILQKIVEKIVIMPQIVEVLKYVHEVTEVESLGVAVDIQTSTYEQRYKGLSANIKNELDILMRELRSLRNPQLNNKIQTIERFLGEFQSFILNPRIIRIPQKQVIEKKVEVEKIIQLPIQDERSLRMELTLSLLVEKLIMELKRVRDTTKIDLQLDQDIKLIFFAELRTKSQLQGNFEEQIKSYSSQIMRQFQAFGNWSLDHQFMLNSFLQQRFLMAELVHNSNIEIQKAAATSEKRLEGLRRYKKDKTTFEGFIHQIGQRISALSPAIQQELGGVFEIFGEFERYSNNSFQEPVRVLQDISLNDQRVQSLLREKQEQIYRLKDLLSRSGFESSKLDKGIFEELHRFKLENGQLKAVIKSLEARIGSSDIETQIGPFRKEISFLQELNFNLEANISELRSNVINLRAENKVLRQLTGDAGKYLNNSSDISQQSGMSNSFRPTPFGKGGLDDSNNKQQNEQMEDEVKPFDSPAQTDIDKKNEQGNQFTPKSKTDKKEQKPKQEQRKDENRYRRY